jgi:hypothetical protein
VRPHVPISLQEANDYWENFIIVRLWDFLTPDKDIKRTCPQYYRSLGNMARILNSNKQHISNVLQRNGIETGPESE